MPPNGGAPQARAFSGKKRVSAWQAAGLGLWASDIVSLSSAMCAGKMLCFDGSLVSLQTFHETNIYLRG